MALRENWFDPVERFEKLQTVAKLRDLVRRLWKIELGFSNKDGIAFDLKRGKPETSPPNPFCSKCLLDSEGLRKCDQTLKEIAAEMRQSGQSKLAIYDQCHVGFKYVAVPVFLNGNLIGAVHGGGFLTEPLDDSKREDILAKTAPFHGTKLVDPEEAFTEIPVLTDSQIKSLGDIVSFGIDEVVRYHVETSERRAAIFEMPKQTHEASGSKFVVGHSKAMQSLISLLEKLRDSDSTVLIQGENGTGKELVAKAIHMSSERMTRPFITQNCSALNDNLLDSELFGHVRGSFTGAIKDKKGLFEVADGGTFFMDEVGDMSPTLQVKLLRVLQEGMFIPVGGTEPKYVNVRIIAATNRNLRKMVEDGQFREDLFYRLNVINISVPSLRDRREDIPALVDHFLQKYVRGRAVGMKTFSSEALDALMAYNWPGNVRQLENEVQRSLVLSGKAPVIEREVLSAGVTLAASGSVQVRLKGKLKDAMEHIERQMILDGLRRYLWNKSKLSRELGISRATLIWKIQKYGISQDYRT